MKACLTPKSLSKGAVLYSFESVSYEGGKCTVEARQWFVRDIQEKPSNINLGSVTLPNSSRLINMVNLVCKVKKVTWIRGKWSRHIPKEFQFRFDKAGRLPKGIYTTELQAIKFAVKEKTKRVSLVQAQLEKSESSRDKETWKEELLYDAKELRLLKSKLTRITNLKNKKLRWC